MVIIMGTLKTLVQDESEIHTSARWLKYNTMHHVDYMVDQTETDNTKLCQIYSNGIWQALLTTRRGSCGRQTTKKIAKGLKIRHAPIHANKSHAGKSATWSNIITSLWTEFELHYFLPIRERVAQTNVTNLWSVNEFHNCRVRRQFAEAQAFVQHVVTNAT